MNKNINLCEILKGHEGEVFYLYLRDMVVSLEKVTKDEIWLLYCNCDRTILNSHGGYKDFLGLQLFPSKDQLDWNKWDKENNSKNIKIPKTWEEYKQYFDINKDDLCVDLSGKSNNGWIRRETPIEKSALALLKIHQLIEVSYGGNVLNNKEKYWEDGVIGYTINICPSSKTYLDGYEIFPIERHNNIISPIMFKTKEYAEEFIKHEENCSLLRIFCMAAYPRDLNS